MLNRLCNILINNSFFLFGARGTGKTYWLERILPHETTHIINLLDPLEIERFSLDPNELTSRVNSLRSTHTHILIDEIQKVPKLLDLVHHHIEKSNMIFALTGSSARKLKRGGANLLAGRAFTYYLFPFSHRELGDSFDLHSALRWGTLPKVVNYNSDSEKEMYLRSYVNTYLKEEIAEEQIVRKLDPFRKFLQVAAQSSGEIINYSKLAKDTGVSTPTVQSYFQILEDTLLGVIIPPFHESVRKRQHDNPKFYFFDYGLKRALERTISLDIIKGTYGYGKAFEHFIVNEIIKLKFAKNLDFELSYLRTYGNAEIDLIIERPGMPRALIEVKSKSQVVEEDLKHLISLGEDIASSESFCLSCDPHAKRIGKVNCFYWKEGLEQLGL